VAIALITLTWCDRHLSEKDEEVPAGPMPAWADGLNVDLCPECAAPYVEARKLAEEYGSKGDRTSSPQKRTRAKTAAPAPAPTGKVTSRGLPATHICPAKDCGAGLSSRPSLAAHARQTHKTSLPALEGKPATYKCDQRGCGRAFSSPQAIALHRKQTHKLTGAVTQQPAAAK
jgi:hypothetical protein